MVALDLGILAYAVNRHTPEHTRAVAVVEALVNGDAPWALPWAVVHGFLGLVTHSHAVARPLRPSDAWGFVGQLLSSPTVRPLGPTERHGAVLVETLASARWESGIPPGLDTATVLREHGVRELLSTNRAMRIYPFLSVRDPLHGEAWTPSEPPLRRYRKLTPPPT